MKERQPCKAGAQPGPSEDRVIFRVDWSTRSSGTRYGEALRIFSPGPRRPDHQLPSLPHPILDFSNTSESQESREGQARWTELNKTRTELNPFVSVLASDSEPVRSRMLAALQCRICRKRNPKVDEHRAIIAIAYFHVPGFPTQARD